MSAAETGIYITLIATMYEKGEPIKEDAPRLARLCGASNSSFKTCLESLISDGKILRKEDGLWNERVQKETVYRLEKSEVGSRAAKTKWDRKRKENNDLTHAPALPSQSDRNANQKPEPEARKKEEETSLRDVAPQAAKTTKRSTRLSEDWVLPKPYGEWALEQGLPRDRILIEATKMRNWSINAKANGSKVNWFLAWQNWVQGAIDDLPVNKRKLDAPRGGELFIAAAERMKDEREQLERENGAGNRRDVDGFPILSIEYQK